MTPPKAEAYRLARPEPLRWCGRRGKAELLAKEEDFDSERLNLDLAGTTIHLAVERALAEPLGGADTLLTLLQDQLNQLPDRALLAAAVSEGQAIAVRRLEASDRLIIALDSLAALHQAALDDPALGRALLAVALGRALRASIKDGPGKASVKRDAGAALLALAADPEARRRLDAAAVEAALAPILAADEPFLALLRASLAAHPLRREAPKVTAADNIFADPRRFDALGFGEKLRVIIAGQLAWYTTLSFGLLGLLRGLWQRWPGRYDEARAALTADIRQRGFFKKALRRRLRLALRQGRPLRALELFWASWNPNLTRVTLRPLFRMLGGNRRPFIATVLTFTFSALVVHLMAWTSAVLALCYVLAERSPTAAWIASPLNLRIQIGAIAAYVLVGVLIGGAKSLRARGA